jgi:hypothetical protein
MSKRARSQPNASAERLLLRLLAQSGDGENPVSWLAASSGDAKDLQYLVASDLLETVGAGAYKITPAGRAHLARAAVTRSATTVDPYLGQHLALAERDIVTADGRSGVTVNEAESPLTWLARRKGRDGRPLIDPVHLQAGERLRADFTRAQLMPRTTSNWSAAVALDGRSANTAATFTDAVIGARQNVRHALEAVGPEFGGLLLDLCCFLKGLEDIERERGWPPRSAKVVLQLGLDRLARHYGLRTEVRGPAHAALRTWLAPGAVFQVDAASGA